MIFGTAGLVLGLIIGGAAGASGSGKGKSSAVAGPTVTVTTGATVHATVTEVITTIEPVPQFRTITEKPTVVKVIATRTHTLTVTYTPPPKPAINDGTYKVGVDIKAGQWRTNGHGGEGGCYWERDSNLSGSLDSIIANDNIDGPTIIEVNDGEYLELSGGCDWRRS